MKSVQPSRVIIADDHRVVRAGISAILTERDEFEVVGEAETAAQAIELAARLIPDLAIVDMRLPDASGAAACRAIKLRAPVVKVVILTSFAEEGLVFDALSAGVDGYLLKDSDDEALVAALLAALRGESVFAPSVVRLVTRSAARERDRKAGQLDALTARELTIVRLVSEGCTYKEVAARLNIAEKTVRNNVSLMLDKLQIESRSQLVSLYARSTTESPGPMNL